MTENLLRHETSPYLLQHKDNPVHWRGWGRMALDEAQRLDKPILLSVGYAACHWCHVMAHESFENPEIADLMNRLFVNVKVDREERPDVDQLYMAGLHALGGRGGWPLTAFLTPQGKLFWGGTYFPPTARFGRAGFPDILQQVAKTYREQPNRVAQNAEKATASVSSMDRRAGSISRDLLDETVSTLFAELDPVNGGLSSAPKFPQAALFEFLWRAGTRTRDLRFQQAVMLVLTKICQGGIFDHVGGGFARYAVDECWRIPHFEKMLYDNAQLIRLLSWAWKASGEALFKQCVTQTIEWLVREMRMSGGAFASSLDADSEGIEGKFYVWTKSQIEAALGESDATLAATAYGVTPEGNWEDVNILNRLDAPRAFDGDARLEEIRQKLLTVRNRRIPPGRDDKILADWNGLAIEAICVAALTFDRPDWLNLARQAYAFVLSNMMQADRVGHSARLGRVSHPGFSSDAACMIAAALALFEATADQSFLNDARRMTVAVEAHHFDTEKGFFLTADDVCDLGERLGGIKDDATPNPNATMAHNFVRLGLLTGETRFLDAAELLFRIFGGTVVQGPFRSLGLLSAFDFASCPIEVVIIGEPESGGALARQVFSETALNIVLTRVSSSHAAPRGSLAYGRPMQGTAPTAYVCREGVCSLPVTTPDALHALLVIG